jgi:hypothetical protein
LQVEKPSGLGYGRGDGAPHSIDSYSMKDLLAASRKLQLVQAVLDTLGNSRAAGLYEKCGFVELDAPPPLPYEARPGNRFYAHTL